MHMNDPEVQIEPTPDWLTLLWTVITVLFFLTTIGEEEAWGFWFVCFPFWAFVMFMWWETTKPRREARRQLELKRMKLANKRLVKKKLEKKKFEEWAMWHHSGLLASHPIRDNPNLHLLWPAWKEYLVVEKNRLESERKAKHLASIEKKAEAAKKKAEQKWKEKKKAEAAKKKATEKRLVDAKRTEANQQLLREALDTLDKKNIKRKMDLVSKYSKKALLEVTSEYKGIRKSGSIEAICNSALSRVDVWISQVRRVEILNDGITKDSTMTDLHAIKQDIGRIELDHDHPLVKRKVSNINKRVTSRKEKLERKRKAAAAKKKAEAAKKKAEAEKAADKKEETRKKAIYFRPMLQTQDVPNATLLRKEKAWKLNGGCCIRCDKPSSEMAFYWDVYPELMLVVICDECADKENFVHADQPEEENFVHADEPKEGKFDLGDDFLSSIGSKK
jgi:hypothetical protein